MTCRWCGVKLGSDGWHGRWRVWECGVAWEVESLGVRGGMGGGEFGSVVDGGEIMPLLGATMYLELVRIRDFLLVLFFYNHII